MKQQLILIMSMLAGVMSVAAPAMDLCVQDNSGCKDVRTGKVYVPEGNKLVDPETRRVYAVIEPVPDATDMSKLILRPGNVKPGLPRDPVTGRVVPGDRRVQIPETQEMRGAIKTPARVVPLIEGGQLVAIPPRDIPVVIKRSYHRTTTCAGLKTEIAALNRQWSELERWNRAEVSARIDRLEALYDKECR